MKYFAPSEFQGWFEQLDPTLKQVLDNFRMLYGRPVMVSPADGAVGRHLGPHSNSRHNVDKWGYVMACDVMPSHMSDYTSAMEAIRLAERAGADGIGVYPHWRPRPGLHLDIRDGKARWGGVREEGRQILVPISYALKAFSL